MSFAVFGEDSTGCIEFSILSVGVPFVFGKMPVIIGVNDGIFAPGQRDASEWVAVTCPTVQQYRPDKYPDKPEWNVNCEPNFLAPRKIRGLEN